MIKVVAKIYLDDPYNKIFKDSEIHRLISVTFSEVDGYVAICERLHDEVDRLRKDTNGKPIPLRKKGDLVAMKINVLRVVRDNNEDERELYLKELQTLLYPQNDL